MMAQNALAEHDDEDDDGLVDDKLPSGDSADKDDRLKNVTADDETEVASKLESDEPDTDPSREKVREKRREERRQKKTQNRERAQRDRSLIESQTRTITDLKSRLDALEKRSSGQDVAQLDTAIDEAQRQVNQAKFKIKQALDSGNGEAMASANDHYYEARRRFDHFTAIKQKISTQSDARPDPDLLRRAHAWQTTNRWYDPSGQDEDSAITIAIDNRLAAEGWDPKSQDYWDELTRRTRSRLPHRFKGQKDSVSEDLEDEDNDEVDDQPPPRKRSKAITGGSGREGSSSTTRSDPTLTQARIQAIKEAGAWDDPERRQRLIDQYRKFDREQATHGRR